MRPRGACGQSWIGYDSSFELHTFVVLPELNRDMVVAAAAITAGASTRDRSRGESPSETYPRGQVDFYEGYWASDLGGTKMAHIARWFLHLVRRLAFHRDQRVVRLRLAWAWGLLLGLAVFVAFAWRWVGQFGGTTWFQWVTRAVRNAVIPGGLGNLGDVARYLDGGVENVAVRQKVRDNLVGLLESLHDGGRNRRVALVRAQPRRRRCLRRSAPAVGPTPSHWPDIRVFGGSRSVRSRCDLRERPCAVGPPKLPTPNSMRGPPHRGGR
ncbi:hypothetical protein LQK93_03498 [Terrabacter sp. BE26]